MFIIFKYDMWYISQAQHKLHLLSYMAILESIRKLLRVVLNARYKILT